MSHAPFKISVISGTSRKSSKTRQVSGLVFKIYQQLGCHTEIIDLKLLDFSALALNPYTKKRPENICCAVKTLNLSCGLVFVCPEYNHSFPGILKFFIDHCDYPKSFYHKPASFVGLGGKGGGGFATAHLMQLMCDNQALIHPQKTCLPHIQNLLKKGRLKDPALLLRLKHQATGFLEFIKKLQPFNKNT